MNRRIALALVVAFASLLGREARADGLIRDGVGAIPIGRGGTNIAFADNGAVLLDNPAGMVRLPGSGLFEIGVDTLVCDLDYADRDPNHVEGAFRGRPLPNISYIQRSDDGCYAYGIGVFPQAGFGADYHMQNPIWGPSKYKSMGALVKVLPGVAVQVTEELSVGATLGLAFSEVDLEGPYTLQTAAPGLPAQLDLKATGVNVTGSIGLQYQLTPWTTLGAVYQEQSRFDMRGRVNATALVPPPLGPFTVSSWNDAQFNLTWPRSVGIGVLHHLCGCQRISAEVIWYDWSEAFDSLDMTLTRASNPLLTAMLGPTIRESFPLNWKDTISVRLGYEKDLSPCDTVRLGYIYHESPVPNSTLCPYVDGVLEHAVCVGYTRRCCSYSWNLAYEYSFGPKREVTDSAILGGDFANSTFTAQAHWLALSLIVPF